MMMTSNPLRTLLAALLASAAFGSTAAPLTLADCESCNGGRYTLSTDGVALPDADPMHETFRVRLQIDTAGVAGAVPGAFALESAAIKVADGDATARLVEAPGALADWLLRLGGLAAQGCNGRGSGFVCADWVGSGVGTPIGGLLDFVFDVTVGNGQLDLDFDGAHVKARFVSSHGVKIGALVSDDLTLNLPPAPLRTPLSQPPETPLSPTGVPGPTEPSTPVPEPAGLALGALGLALLATTRRRRV